MIDGHLRTVYEGVVTAGVPYDVRALPSPAPPSGGVGVGGPSFGTHIYVAAYDSGAGGEATQMLRVPMDCSGDGGPPEAGDRFGAHVLAGAYAGLEEAAGGGGGGVVFVRGVPDPSPRPPRPPLPPPLGRSAMSMGFAYVDSPCPDEFPQGGGSCRDFADLTSPALVQAGDSLGRLLRVRTDDGPAGGGGQENEGEVRFGDRFWIGEFFCFLFLTTTTTTRERAASLSWHFFLGSIDD